VAVPRLTLATYNVHWGLTYPDREPYDVVADCALLDTDVLVLQEAWRTDGEPGVVADVASALGYHDTSVSLGRGNLKPKPHLVQHKPSSGDWYLSVLTRAEPSATRVVDLRRLRLDPARQRQVVLVDLDVDGWRLTVAGAHLPHLEHGSPVLAPSLRRALPSRDTAAVVAGDMNMWGWCIDRMLPGWRRLAVGRTWPARRPHSQIDHVLGTPLVGCASAEVVPVTNSDHRPLRVELTPA
jgi:endonuclease/exonuclease/phosphatase family metal-dependent hydrolase